MSFPVHLLKWPNDCHKVMFESTRLRFGLRLSSAAFLSTSLRLCVKTPKIAKRTQIKNHNTLPFNNKSKNHLASFSKTNPNSAVGGRRPPLPRALRLIKPFKAFSRFLKGFSEKKDCLKSVFNLSCICGSNWLPPEGYGRLRKPPGEAYIFLAHDDNKGYFRAGDIQ